MKKKTSNVIDNSNSIKKNNIGGIFNNFVVFIKKLGKGIGDIFKNVIDSIKKMGKKIKIGDLFKKFIELIKKLIDKILKIDKRISISVVSVIFLIFVIIYAVNYIENKSNISYNKIKDIVENNDTAVIYYFNSKSKDRNNVKFRKYMDSLEFNYYKFNIRDAGKKNGDKVLDLLNIDKKVFGEPAVIFIKDGKMFGNIININDEKIIKRFVDDHDLLIVK